MRRSRKSQVVTGALQAEKRVEWQLEGPLQRGDSCTLSSGWGSQDTGNI